MRHPAIRVPSHVVLLLLLSAALPANAADTVERSLQEQFELPAGTALRIENLIGSMRVDGGGEAGRVLVKARVVADAADLAAATALAEAIGMQTEEADGTLAIRLTYPVDQHTAFRFPRSETGKNLLTRWVTPMLKRGAVATEYQGRSVEIGNSKGAAQVAVHLEVVVPFDIEASFKQVMGSLHCARSRGSFELEVIDGEALAQQLNGALEARTGRADLTVKTFRGERLSLQTGSGAVDVSDIHVDEARLRSSSGDIEGLLVNVAALHVDSGDGNVSLADFEPGSFELNTTSGSVDLATRLRRATGGSVHSETGNVTLRFGGLTSFELDASAPSGSVKFKGLPLEVLREDEQGMLLKHRSGGRSVVVRTGNGDVLVRAL
jgi:hypothetical protein